MPPPRAGRGTEESTTSACALASGAPLPLRAPNRREISHYPRRPHVVISRPRSVCRRALDYFSSLLSVLDWARRSGEAAPYLECCVLLQEAHLQHLSAIKMGNLYKISWVRDMIGYD